MCKLTYSLFLDFSEHVILFRKYTPDSLVFVFSTQYPTFEVSPNLFNLCAFIFDLSSRLYEWIEGGNLCMILSPELGSSLGAGCGSYLMKRWGPDMSSLVLMGFVMAFANRNDSLPSIGSFLPSLIVLWLSTVSWHVNLLTALESVVLEGLRVAFKAHCLRWAWDSIHVHQDNPVSISLGSSRFSLLPAEHHRKPCSGFTPQKNFSPKLYMGS